VSRVAFVTMVRDEEVFLPIWVAYYSRFVSREHLYILCDGLEQRLPVGCDGCQVLRLPEQAAESGWDEARWRMLSDFASALLARYDTVVLNDVDEIIVLDPQHGEDLLSELAATREIGVISPFALELVHRTDLEPERLDPDRRILGQRRYVRLNASYCKPCVTSRKLRWSLGGHYSDHPLLSLSRRLFLFHLKYVDRELLLARQAKRLGLVKGDGSHKNGVAGPGWSKSVSEIDSFLASFVAKGPPESTDCRFDWQRRRIEASWAHDDESGLWTHRTFHNRRTYELPNRFMGLF
jgi:hypothetical protein